MHDDDIEKVVGTDDLPDDYWMNVNDEKENWNDDPDPFDAIEPWPSAIDLPIEINKCQRAYLAWAGYPDQKLIRLQILHHALFLEMCRSNQLGNWMLSGAQEVLLERVREGRGQEYSSDPTRHSGKGGTERSRLLYLYIHYWRWCAVRELRNDTSSYEIAYELTSKKLRGTLARGSSGAIKKSYESINSDRNKENGHDRYDWLPASPNDLTTFSIKALKIPPTEEEN